MIFRILFIVLYALASVLSLRLAFVMRFYFDPLPFQYGEMLLQVLPIAVICKTVAVDVFGLTRSLWRFASFRDLKGVMFSVITGWSLFLAVSWLWVGRIPNGVLLLDLILTAGLFTAIRFSGRCWEEVRHFFQDDDTKNASRVLVLGAGVRGQMALRFLQEGSAIPLKVVGFLDEDSVNVGRRLLGVPILGRPEDLPEVLEKKSVQELVISEAGPGPEKIRQTFEVASAYGCRVSLLPEFIGAGAHANPIRELKMSDFLGREAVALDSTPLMTSLGGLTVLVTGAGGSIGSELCRQIAALPVKKVVLLDFSETALFEISEELGGGVAERAEHGMAHGELRITDKGCSSAASDPRAPIDVLLCDIRNEADVAEVFAVHQPQVVFHAAAYKHVPMMEKHPLEAARTNVLGTQNVVQCAKKSGVERLLHVSTDKVVEAEGVMGGSKAWGERIVRAAGYNCVRFGNVLGSSGSVIPLFEKQWEREGQLQVTHREATRYFMTIEEAVLLMLHAEALQGRGDVYILDMGKPVKILDLAKQMVGMRRGLRSMTDSGLRIEERAEHGNAEGEMEEQGETDSPSAIRQLPSSIRIVGLRPGERIHERLHTPEEKLTSTPVPKVNKLSGAFDPKDLEGSLARLSKAVTDRDIEEIRKLLIQDGKSPAGGYSL